MRLLLSLAMALVCLAIPAFGQDPPTLLPTVLIVDSSASMSGRVGGRIKLDAAREVILDSIGTWRPETQFALLAYGHRRAGDCADIETMLPLGPLDLAETEDELDRLRARGKTPLASSLELAAEQLPPEGGAIVLVSDGLETCEADPCLVAAELHRGNPGITIQVIGFGVTEAERQGLSCIAAGGGGRLFSAADAPGLTAALAVIGDVSGARPEEPRLVDPAETATLELRLVASAGEPLDEAVMAGPVAWTVEPLGGSGPVRISDLREPDIALLPGRYRISARFGEWLAEAEAEALPRAVTPVSLDLRLGRVVLETASTPEGPALDGGEGLSWEFAKAERPELYQSVLSIARPTLIAQEGDYVARLKGPEVTLSAPARVTAGETTIVRIVAPEMGSE